MTLLLVLIIVALCVVIAALTRRSVRDRRSLSHAVRRMSRSSTSIPGGQEDVDRLSRILAAMPEGVMVIDGNDVVFTNPAVSVLLGGDPSRIVPNVTRSTQANFLVTVHHPTYREVRCARTSLDGDAVLVVCSDVTEARRVDRMRHDFVANASHELKTPVAAILATSETLQSAIEDDKAAAKRFAEVLGLEAKRLGDMVQDLLDLARLDQGSSQPAGDVDTFQIASELVAEARDRESGLTFEITGEPGALVPVHATDLSLAIRNLIENACRHTSSGGRVTTSVSVHDSDVQISVADDGEGIPARDLPRIFERFYRVDRARSRDTGGTGLGLAIVRHVVESAGGTVSATSTYGEGSTFTISLPRSEA